MSNNAKAQTMIQQALSLLKGCRIQLEDASPAGRAIELMVGSIRLLEQPEPEQAKQEENSHEVEQ